MVGKALCLCLVLMVTVTSAKLTFSGFVPDDYSQQSLHKGKDSIIPLETPCHMEMQVTQQFVGHCVTLGQTSDRGCMAGVYLQPYHEECMV